MRGSGLNWSNISAGFGGVSQALGQGLSIKAQQQLEEMKDARAENLARLSFGWKAQHDVNLQERSFQHDTRIEQMRDELQGKQIMAQQQLQQTGNEAYMNRIMAMQEAERRRGDDREDAQSRMQTQRLIEQNRIEMQRAVEEHDQRTAQLMQEISRATAGNPIIASQTDPAKRQQMMAQDPTIGPMLDQLSQMNLQRSKVITSYTEYGAQLGDPSFKGITTSQLPNPPTGSAGSGFDSSGGPPATPNNPLDHQVPAYPSNNDADNTPAVTAPTPGSRPVTAQPAPTTSMVGPLRAPAPSLIPGANPRAGASAPGQFANIGSPMGAAPSLIPPQQPQQQGF